MKYKWLTTMLLILIATVSLSACDQSTTEQGEDEKLNVVASFYPMYEFTSQIAGDRADVSIMVSAGEDAHHYEPSAQDVAAVHDADVFVYSSEEMEFWAESLLDTVENNELVVARAADYTDFVDTSNDGHSHDHEGESNSSVTVDGVAHHYHTGDMIELTADLKEDADYDHWHWYTRESEDGEWETVPEQGTHEFEYEAPDHSFEVQAAVLDNEHNAYAESEPIEIVIDNHDDHDHDHHDHGDEHDHEHDHHEEDESEAIDITGLAEHYHTGDVVTLKAQLDSDIDYDDWHWYRRESSSDEWEMMSDQDTNLFEYTTTGTSFETKVALYDDEHHVYAESDPVEVIIDDHEDIDPHIWLDPLLAQEQVNAIRDALIEADPDGEETYNKNADAFNAELESLHEDYESAFEDAENRAFVVQHQAFGYIAHRYDLEQVSIGGLSTEVEPSPSRIAEVGDTVEEYGVPVIYYQHGSNSDIAETVANETHTQTAVLHDLEVLSEELTEEGLGYIEAMQENLEALQLSIH